MQQIDFPEIILGLIGGVVVFLYGMQVMTETMKDLAGDRMNAILARFTTHIVAGIITGAIVTAVMGSSSLVIIMTIALVNAKILNFRQAMGIVMGSNIGTTMASQIIAFKLSDYAALVLLAGLITIFAAKNLKTKQIGTVVLNIGLIFFGLDFMDLAVLPLRDYAPLKEWMAGLENPVNGVFVGGVITFIIQASSATVAMAISLAGQGMLSLPAGIAVMMGAEIGTCSDTLLASIGRSRAAIRTGIFHLVFNIISVIVGVIFFTFFVQFIVYISGNSNASHQIANAHVLFNTLGVVIFAFFIPLMDKWLTYLIPDRPLKEGVETV